MTDWTKEDTEALQAEDSGGSCDHCDGRRKGKCGIDCLARRAAAHIEALETRVAGLEEDAKPKPLHTIVHRKMFDEVRDRLEGAAAHIERLEAERAEVAREMRLAAEVAAFDRPEAVVRELGRWATRLERKVEP